MLSAFFKHTVITLKKAHQHKKKKRKYKKRNFDQNAFSHRPKSEKKPMEFTWEVNES